MSSHRTFQDGKTATHDHGRHAHGSEDRAGRKDHDRVDKPFPSASLSSSAERLSSRGEKDIRDNNGHRMSGGSTVSGNGCSPSRDRDRDKESDRYQRNYDKNRYYNEERYAARYHVRSRSPSYSHGQDANAHYGSRRYDDREYDSRDRRRYEDGDYKRRRYDDRDGSYSRRSSSHTRSRSPSRSRTRSAASSSHHLDTHASVQRESHRHNARHEDYHSERKRYDITSSALDSIKAQLVDNSGAVEVVIPDDSSEDVQNGHVDEMMDEHIELALDEDATRSDEQAAAERRKRRLALLQQDMASENVASSHASAILPLSATESTIIAPAVHPLPSHPTVSQASSNISAMVPAASTHEDNRTHIIGNNQTMTRLENENVNDPLPLHKPSDEKLIAEHDAADGTQLPVRVQPNSQPQLHQRNATVSESDDDDLDIFNDSPSKIMKSLKHPIQALHAVNKATSSSSDSRNPSLNMSINQQDTTTSDGFYQFRVNDVLDNGRYIVTSYQGSGVFSTVLRAVDTPDEKGEGKKEVVIKVLRNNDTMRKAGQNELTLLQLLAQNDPLQRKHVIQLRGSFIHYQHLCLVFEPLYMDLRRLIKKFGSVGLSIDAVRSYSKQLFTALKHLGRHNIIHADIKPDNILCSDNMNIVKICDLGSAVKIDRDTMELTPYLCSRFYRAPEVILGITPPTAALDVWSMGAVLYELYTGSILFPGKTNNQMLQYMIDVKGNFPARTLKRGQFTHQHFSLDNYTFLLHKTDPVTQKVIKQAYQPDKPKHDLYTLLKGRGSQSTGGMTHKEIEHHRKKLRQLADMIHKCIEIDSTKRWTPEQLLKHPFITE